MRGGNAKPGGLVRCFVFPSRITNARSAGSAGRRDALTSVRALS